MSDNPDQLQQRILRELTKTGYPTEITTGALLAQKQWRVVHNPSYRDADENVAREFDLEAYRHWTVIIPGGRVAIGVFLVVECKKSEKPWVFFTAPEHHDGPRLGALLKWDIPNLRVFTDRDHDQSLIPDDVLRESHHYFSRSSLARTFYQPFKGKAGTEASPMIYSAVMSAVKAVLFHMQEPPIPYYLRIYYPLLVFDGNLFEACVAADKSIQLTAVPYLQLSFHYMMPMRRTSTSVWQGGHSFIVDVVQAQHLEPFLDTVKAEHDILVDRLRQAIGTE